MKIFLIDTDISVYYLKGLNGLREKFSKVKAENIFISEITLAELKFGAENSVKIKENLQTIDKFVSTIQILPIFNCIDFYAKEKARLKKSGQIIDDFDLLIGCSSVVNKLVLVTNNEKHFSRISNIKIENWIDKLIK